MLKLTFINKNHGQQRLDFGPEGYRVSGSMS